MAFWPTPKSPELVCSFRSNQTTGYYSLPLVPVGSVRLSGSFYTTYSLYLHSLFSTYLLGN